MKMLKRIGFLLTFAAAINFATHMPHADAAHTTGSHDCLLCQTVSIEFTAPPAPQIPVFFVSETLSETHEALAASSLILLADCRAPPAV